MSTEVAWSRVERTLLTEEQIAARVRELAVTISEDYRGEEVLLVGVLRGAFIFLADLARRLTVPNRVDFIALASYVGAESGAVRLLMDLRQDIAGRHVLLVEDVIDSGLTLSYLLKNLRSRAPASLEICTLLAKPGHKRLGISSRYVGFELPDVFVIGYGLDYAQRYRNLPYIAELEL
jgi:hypoxanthine phosphoribosyltransferase